MKKVVCFIVIILVMFMYLPAVVAAKEIKTAVELGYFTDYVGFAGMLVYDDPVLQQSITLSYNPVYFKIWDSISPKNRDLNDNYGDEFDIVIGAVKNIGDVRFDFGVSYYNLYNLKNIKGDLYAVYVDISWSKLYLYLEGDIPQDENILEGGIFYRLGADHNFLKKSKYTFYSCISISGNDGLCGFRPEFLSNIRLEISKSFETKIGAFTPMINAQTNLWNNKNDSIAEDRIYGGIKWAKSF